MQPVWLDGKLVGEIPCTGDREKDVKAAQALLKAKKLYREDPKPVAMLHQAASFAKVALDMYEGSLREPPFDGACAAPFVVNAAFSAEVFLKLLHLLLGNTKKGHALHELYSELPESIKSDIKGHAVCLLTRYGLDSATDVEALLGQVNTAFVDWRYKYETPPGLINFTAFCFVLDVLGRTCQSRVQGHARDVEAH